MKFWKKKQEVRADNETTQAQMDVASDNLLRALLDEATVTRDTALQIPTVAGTIDLIGDMVAAAPVRLYSDDEEKGIVEVKNDRRVFLLNEDCGDTLNNINFWKAITRDMLVGKGGYAFINGDAYNVKSLHYVAERHVSFLRSPDPIFKYFEIMVNGKAYYPHQFMKFLRNTEDGADGMSIVKENSKILSTTYATLEFEENMVRTGGNRKGFLKSAKKLTTDAMDKLKEAFRKLYNKSSENVVVLNDGIDFKEAQNTSVEMQLNENKETNEKSLSKIFHCSQNILEGQATEDEVAEFVRIAVVPILNIMQKEINRTLLAEEEKGKYRFEFDTKEISRGSIQSRYEAYKAGIDCNVLQIDEARNMENLPALGLDFIKLGLADVLYNPKTKEVYTPNTGKTSSIEKGGEPIDSRIES